MSYDEVTRRGPTELVGKKAILTQDVTVKTVIPKGTEVHIVMRDGTVGIELTDDYKHNRQLETPSVVPIQLKDID